MKKNSFKFLLLIAFVSGLCVMGIEISASRLLAPYFGNSVLVWTNIIGIVMVALSCGYYFGGKLADKKPELKIVLQLILIAGLIFLTVPWIVRPVSEWIISFSNRSLFWIIFLGSFFVTFILFAFPLFLLGMVTPFVIKLSRASREKTGEITGTVFAVSTLGSLLGTFLPSLILIPFWGTRFTISVFAACLVVLSFLGGVLRKEKTFFLVALVLFSVSQVGDLPIKSTQNMIHEEESLYQYIQVLERQNNRYLATDNQIIHSVFYKNYPNHHYYIYHSALPFLLEQGKIKNVLILGLAGGTMVRQMKELWGESVKIDAVDIDERMIELGKEYLNLKEDSVRIHHADARIFLKTTSQKYDLVVLDAFCDNMYVPWTLVTREFWGMVLSRLRPYGMVSMNMVSSSQEDLLMNGILNTLASVFKRVSFMKISSLKGPGNYIILASQSPISFLKARQKNKIPQLEKIFDSFAFQNTSYDYRPQKIIFTDDYAPVEFLTELWYINYLK